MIDQQELLRKWFSFEDERELNERIENGIEENRKGTARLRFFARDGRPLSGVTVRVKQTKHDFRIGANLFQLDELETAEKNRRYREAFPEYFNLATVPFYWDGLEPEEGKPRFSKDSPRVYRRPAPDLCMEYCAEKGIDAKLHCLIYDNFIPDWLPVKDEKAMEEAYARRFAQIAERYADRLWEVEVINELLWEHLWKKKSVISDKPDIIEWSFALARRYFPENPLTINESNPLCVLGRQDYRHPYFLMVQNALRGGACIDRIGLQHHIFAGALASNEKEYEDHVLRDPLLIEMADPQLILRGLDIMATLGKPLEITEVTVPTVGEGKTGEEFQARLLRLLYRTWFSHPAVDAVVYWNVPDGYAHINPGTKWNENNCCGGLLTHELEPKMAANTLKELFSRDYHTELTLTTDENGTVDFRGFYGTYEAETPSGTVRFGLHKSEKNETKIVL